MSRKVVARFLLTLFLIFALNSYIQALSPKAEEKKEGKPPLSATRIAGEVGAGTALGLLGAGLPIVLFSSGEGEDWGGLFAMVAISPITYTLGSIAGVYLVGNIGDETGYFPSALLGGIAGGAIAITKWILTLEKLSDSDVLYKTCMITGLMFAPIGATIAFNLSRKYESFTSVIPEFSVGLIRGEF